MVASNEKMLCDVEMAKGKAATTNVSIPREQYVAFSAACEKRGLSVRNSVARLINYWMRQQPPVQTAILGIEDGMQASYAATIEALLDELQGKPRLRSGGNLVIGAEFGKKK